MPEIKAIAKRIAEKANECCNRSDGYEEGLAAFAEKEIASLLSNKHPETRTWNGMEIAPTGRSQNRAAIDLEFISGLMSHIFWLLVLIIIVSIWAFTDHKRLWDALNYGKAATIENEFFNTNNHQ